MKLNKSKTKGKVHPSPSSSSSSSSSSPFSLSSNSNDPISSLNLLLPATILTLISTLSFQDREILAYMFTNSLKSSAINLNHHHDHKRKSKKSSPSFHCDCFDCYTSYWFRWDSSPCRELIHQAIEAFEEHLATSEQPKKTTSCRKKDKERNTPVSELVSEESPDISPKSEEYSPESRESPEERERNKKTTRCRKKDKERNRGHRSSVSEELPEISPESMESPAKGVAGGESAAEERKRNKKQQQLGQENKGLARKVLPDVIGLFNSRLWNLWGPNV